MVGLLAHVVLAGVHQSINFGFALFFVILQVRTERTESAGGRPALFKGIMWHRDETAHLSRQHGVVLYII